MYEQQMYEQAMYEQKCVCINLNTEDFTGGPMNEREMLEFFYLTIEQAKEQHNKIINNVSDLNVYLAETKSEFTIDGVQ